MTAEVAGRIFFVGLMGSGKTTLGRSLADTLGREYVDNDSELRLMTGQSATELAARGGTVLHDAEAQYVQSLLMRPAPFVASVPASIVERSVLSRLLSASGFVVYVRATPRVLANRVVHDPARPWLTEEALPTLAQMFESRDHAFEQMAALVINTDSVAPYDAVNQVLDELRGV